MDNPDRVSVNVEPTFWEIYTASLVLIFYQRSLIILHLLFPSAGLALLIVSYIRGFPQGVAPVIAIGFLCVFFTPLLTAQTAFSARRNKLMQGPFVYTFDSDGVRTRSAVFDQSINWNAVVKVRESKAFLFIFISASKALYIPVKALRDQGVLEAVRTIVRLHGDVRR